MKKGNRATRARVYVAEIKLSLCDSGEKEEWRREGEGEGGRRRKRENAETQKRRNERGMQDMSWQGLMLCVISVLAQGESTFAYCEVTFKQCNLYIIKKRSTNLFSAKAIWSLTREEAADREERIRRNVQQFVMSSPVTCGSSDLGKV
jgi:hypothetical protein